MATCAQDDHITKAHLRKQAVFQRPQNARVQRGGKTAQRCQDASGGKASSLRQERGAVEKQFHNAQGKRLQGWQEGEIKQQERFFSIRTFPRAEKESVDSGIRCGKC